MRLNIIASFIERQVHSVKIRLKMWQTRNVPESHRKARSNDSQNTIFTQIPGFFFCVYSHLLCDLCSNPLQGSSERQYGSNQRLRWFKAEAPSREQGMENSLISSAPWCEFTAEHPDTSLLQKCPQWCLHVLPTQQLYRWLKLSYMT